VENILMDDIIGLDDVSSIDTGKGKQLKTGGRRKHNMADKCKTGQVYSAKLKKCVTKKSPWDKYMSGGNLWLKNKATKQEKAVVDSMQKEIMSRGKKKTKKTRGN
jgi:hypothetical protein